MRLAMCAAGIVLFAVTWRVWTPQRVFPQVPLFGWGVNAPEQLDWLGAAGIALSLGGALVLGRKRRIANGLLSAFACCIALMVCLDQHRLQPWAYHLALIALVLSSLPPRRALVWLRVLTISIYVYSALSKLDISFLDQLGALFLRTLLELCGLSSDNLAPGVRRALVLHFPLGELAVAVGLSARPTRLGALVGATVMHCVMIALLGPLGLAHRPAVLIWNVFFIAQDWILFGPWPRTKGAAAEVDAVTARWERGRAAAVQWIVALAILLPLVEPWGFWDHWPAWGLYSSRAERVVVLVEARAAGKLPAHVRPFLQSADPARYPEGWLRMSLDRWSLGDLAVPIYPQSRFQIGAAAAVAELGELGEGIQAWIENAPNRWTGARSRRRLGGEQAIVQSLSDYWLNARPRTNLP